MSDAKPMSAAKLIAIIVVSLLIFSAIVGGVYLWYLNAKARGMEEARVDDARNNAVLLHSLAEQFKLQKRRCPRDIAELAAAGFASRESADPWGGEYRISCAGSDSITVTSAGSDRSFGTDDDVTYDGVVGP